MVPIATPLDKTFFPRHPAGAWHLNRIRRSTASGRNTAGLFQEWDDLTLARWLAQTLGQLEGQAWRLSHPLVGAYRLAAQLAHNRQIWFKRLATPPAAYAESPCCRAPFLPLLTRDVRESGLICQHCNETLVPFDEIAADVRAELDAWAKQYEPVHAVAHWDDRQRRRVGNYDAAYENAAQGGRAIALARRPRPRAEVVESLSGHHLGGPGRMPRSAARRRGGVIYDFRFTIYDLIRHSARLVNRTS